MRALWVVLTLLVGCSSAPDSYEVVLDKLDEPRGLTITSDGRLCVAEAGYLTPDQEVRRGPGAYYSQTGALTCLGPDGQRTHLIEKLPYVYYNIPGVSSGATDIVEMDGELYLLVGEGKGPLTRAILRYSSEPEVIVDFYQYALKTTEPDMTDQIVILSNPFAMVADRERGRFLVTDGASGRVYSAGLDGPIEVFAPVEGHEVLTGIVWGPGGYLYVASFSQIPHDEGLGAILRVFEDGTHEVVMDKLTTPIDLAFDSAGRMLVLEFALAADSGHPYRGKVGRLVRFERTDAGWGERQILVTGLPFPVGLWLADDDSIYISIHGAFSEADTGKVLHFKAFGEDAAPVAYRE